MARGLVRRSGEVELAGRAQAEIKSCCRIGVIMGG